MPTNVTSEYAHAQRKYEDARTVQEKITALEEMIREEPRHKGAEVLRAELGRRMTRLKEELKRQNAARKGSGHSMAVKKQGFQICIVGTTNTGKSTLLKKLTNANPRIAAYPFTTKVPEVGMMEAKGALVQMVEIPALERGASDKQAELLSIVMNADGLIMMTRNDEERDILTHELNAFGINKPTMHLRFKDDVGKEQIMRHFSLIRAYTKEPGREAEMDRPVVLRDGSSVLDAAKSVHKDFHQNMKYARVWGSSRFPGQRVEKTYALRDGDVVEFHI